MNDKLTNKEKEIAISLNQEQWLFVLQCMDVTIKAGGILNARAVVPVYDKIENQLTLENKV